MRPFFGTIDHTKRGFTYYICSQYSESTILPLALYTRVRPYQTTDTYILFCMWLIICSRFNAKLVEVNDPYIVLVTTTGERDSNHLKSGFMSLITIKTL